MNNNDQFSEQDVFIKNKLQDDKISDQQLFDKVANNINNSKVKVSTFSYTKQILTIIVLIVLIIIVCLFFITKILCISLLSKDETTETNTIISNRINDKGTYVIKEDTNNDVNTNTENTNVVNELSNEISNETSNELYNNTANYIDTVENILKNDVNTISNSTSDGSSFYANLVPSNTTTNISSINLDHLKKFIEDFSIGIERISLDNENLESNTILLFIAKHYFDTTNSKSLNIDTDYAATINNIHKYLSEFTGNDYSKVTYLRSYNNYIGYTKTSNSYVSGKNINDLTREKYSVSNIEITNEFNHVYTATAKVTRTIGDEETNYKITFDFSINQNYKYQEFCLKSLKAVNNSFFPDNTKHLVEN